MTERLNSSPEKPPKWWHEAIRNNLPGNLVNPDKFVSFPVRFGEKFSYIIVSQTANDPNGYEEGIFVDTDIPFGLADSIVPSMKEIMEPVAKIFKDDPHGVPVPHPDPRIADLGFKVNLDASFGIDLCSSNGFIVFEICPAGQKELDAYRNEEYEDVKARIVGRYFENYDIVERAEILNIPGMTQSLQKELLEMEFRIMDATESTLIDYGIVTKQRISEVTSDPELKKMYEKFIQRLFIPRFPGDTDSLRSTLYLMDPTTMVGFFHAYRKYWEDKLGPLGQ